MRILLLLCLFPATAFAEEKIGYLDMQVALTQTVQGKREQAALKKDSEDKQKKLDKLQTDIKAMKDDYDKQAPMLKDEARQRRQADLQTKIAELQQMYMSQQKELSDKGNAITKEIVERARHIAEKIGDRDGYTLILERNEANVIYYKRDKDITDELVRTYDTLYK